MIKPICQLSAPQNLTVPPLEVKGQFIKNPGFEIKYSINRDSYILKKIPIFLQRSWYYQGAEWREKGVLSFYVNQNVTVYFLRDSREKYQDEKYDPIGFQPVPCGICSVLLCQKCAKVSSGDPSF